MRIHPIFVAAAMAAFAAPGSAGAQDATHPAAPWVGCWEAVDGLSAGRTCIAPTGADAMTLYDVAPDGKVTQSTIRLDGARTPVSAEGCTGWEQARLSKDGERVLIDAEVTCDDVPQQKRSSAFVITPAGFWVQVHATGIAVVGNPRIRAFRPVASYEGLPAEVRAAVVPNAAMGELARVAMEERTVSAKDLLELESLGVAASVIDLVVAAGYPKSFTIDAQGMAPTAVTQVAGVAPRRADLYMANGFPMFSAYDQMLFERCMLFSAFSGCDLRWMYGYSPFSRFGGSYFGGWGYGWPGWGLPVVVRPTQPAPSDPDNSTRGRAVAGRGYTNEGTTTRTASPRTETQRSGGSANASAGGYSSGGSSAGASSAGSSGSSSGGSARTAKPRNP